MADVAPTPEAKEAELDPGWQPSTKLSAFQTGAVLWDDLEDYIVLWDDLEDTIVLNG